MEAKVFWVHADGKLEEMGLDNVSFMCDADNRFDLGSNVIVRGNEDS